MLSLSILVVLHEGGHFLPARLFGTRVEKFYLFFDPGFSLIKKQIGETEYGIGWLPLGGYVKISGMVDESFDSEQLAGEPQPWEFRSKPAWQRLIIMLGGVTVNFILGFFIYSMVLWSYGDEFLPAENVAYGIAVDSIGTEIGLQNGDKILTIGETPFTKFNAGVLIRGIVLDNAEKMTVLRNNEETEITIDNRWVKELTSFENKGAVIFRPRLPFVVAAVSEGAPAETAGFIQRDSITSVDGVATPFFTDFVEALKGREKEEINVGFYRDGAYKEVSLTTDENGMIGVARANYDHFFETDRINYTLAQSIPAGVKKGVNFLDTQFKAFGKMFTGEIRAKDSLGGFASIGSMFGSEWIWERFWLLTAALSLILAFMNLLPIPALDGGHVMFLLYEVVSGRKPSDKFLERATIVGFVLVIGLVLYVNGLDFMRYVFGKG